MQSLIDKYEKILQKPQPEPFKAYIEELLAHIKGNEVGAQVQKPRKQYGGIKPNPLEGYQDTPIVNP